MEHDNIIYPRDISMRVMELEKEVKDSDLTDGADNDARYELATLQGLLDKIRDKDNHYPALLIRDGHLKASLAPDYTAIDYDGVTYWYR